MTADVRDHPDYEDGFFAASRKRPLKASASSEYAAGWNAYRRCELLLLEAGFTDDGQANFSKTMII